MKRPTIIVTSIRREFDVTRAVLQAGKSATDFGFNENACWKISTAVAELSRNILVYARTGDISIRKISLNGTAGIEVVATDQGPGIVDIDKAMTDHHSTGNSLGLGLPGVKRLMDEFNLETSKNGTRIKVKKWI